jgi:cell division protein FtsI (penicillin-binding protein 3)
MARDHTYQRSPAQQPVAAAGRGLRLRAALAMGGVLVAFLVMAGRLAQLQIAQGASYRRLADGQQVMNRQLTAWRGAIYDRHGRPLAATRQRASICADPRAAENPDRTASLLSQALSVPRPVLLARLERDSYFVWVKRNVSDEEADLVEHLKLPGVFMRRESKRLYPNGRLAAHVIGFTDVDGRGLAGIERQMDAVLKGRPGLESVLCDGGRRVYRSPRDKVEREPFDGYDVSLTIDRDIQNIAEEELEKAAATHAPECAVAIVMDARDGSVLAMASWPSFDPQHPADSPPEHERNVAITDAYEYGSAFKPIPVALAIERGQVSPESTFDCHQGEWRIGNRTLHDVHPYGVLTVSDIICHSSNIGAAQVAMALGIDRLYEGVRDFGFGSPTGIALPGEAGGILRPRRAWSNYSVVSVAFGQELAVTPLAVVRAFAALGNGGALLQPRIVQSIRHSETGDEIYSAGQPVVSGWPVSPGTAQAVVQMMRRVVQEGTGTRARDDEYPLAGKTGTAQLLSENGRGYSPGRYLSSFVAVGPVPHCRIAVVVSLCAPKKNGYYGGTVAAPAVREIATRTLRQMRVPPAGPTQLALAEPR